jgi:integrase/recombinase XerC
MPDRTAALLRAYRTHLVGERQAEPATWAAHRRTVRALAAHAGRPPRQWTVADLDAYTRRGLADATRAQYTSHLRSFTAWATDQGHLERDPFARVRLPRASQPAPRDVSLADLGRLLAYATPTPRLWVAVWLEFGAGLRSMEVAGARRELVRLDDGVPSVEVFGKGRRWRTVPLDQVLVDVLRVWLAQDWPAPSGPLVPSERDPLAHMSAAWVSRLVCRALRDCGVAETAHGLRHAFAKRILAECNDLRAVQELLGHATLASTERYTRGLSARTVRAVRMRPDPRHAASG